MRVSPQSVGVIHFIGIGGIGMSGIAEILHQLKYAVRGSDISNNPNVERLQLQGIEVSLNQSAENVAGASVVVVSSAIKNDNVELQAAYAKGIPIVHRAEMLAELMRLRPSIAVSGSHGKTTTTSILAHILQECGEDPTIVSGGIINTLGTNAHLGKGKWMVVEADESDGSFIKLPATHAIVTSIDAEHMDHYGTFNEMVDAFRTFVLNLPFYGTALICSDNPQAFALAKSVTQRRVLTYGLAEGADVRAVDVKPAPDHTSFRLQINRTGAEEVSDLKFILPMVGQHNVQNALAAIGIALEIGVSTEKICAGLASFKGVQRRFTTVGVVDGITIVDDYAHHPVEIAKTIESAGIASSGRVIAVVQPHRYSRLQALMNEFSSCCLQADVVIIAPVHAAGEDPIAGVDNAALAAGMRKGGQQIVEILHDKSNLANLLVDLASAGDYIVCMGAGSISSWARDLPAEMESLLVPAAVKQAQ